MDTQQTKNDSYLIICLTFMFASMLSGYKGITYIIQALFCFLTILNLRAKNKHISFNTSWKFFVGFLIFYTATSLLTFDAANYIIYMLIYVLMFVSIIITQTMFACCSDKTIKQALKCFLGVFILFCVISCYNYIRIPGLARMMASHQAEEEISIGGGYSLAYAAAIIGVYFFSKIINKCIKPGFGLVVIILICAYLVYLTESTITLFAMIAGLLVSILTKKNETKSLTYKEFVRFMAVFFIIGIVTLFFVLNRYEIAEWILSMTKGKEDSLIHKRIAEIVDKLVYGEETYHVTVRSATLENSVEVFSDNPVFGTGYKYGYVFNAGKNEYNVGNHSEILDAFAKYGVFGAILWLQPYFYSIMEIAKKNIGCVATILIMMFFNPFGTLHTNIVLFFMIPVTEELLRRKDCGETEPEGVSEC